MANYMNKNNSTNSNTTNNINKEENIMGKINLISKKANKSTVEIVKGVYNGGTQVEYIVVDGINMGVVGYANDSDKEAAIAAINQVIESTDKHGYELCMEIMNVMKTAAAMQEHGDNPNDTEEVEIDGVPTIINYKTRKAMIGIENSLREIANLDDIKCALPNEGIKALLAERCKTWIAQNVGNNNYEDDYDEEEDY